MILDKFTYLNTSLTETRVELFVVIHREELSSLDFFYTLDPKGLHSIHILFYELTVG